MGGGLKPMNVDVYFDPPSHQLYGNQLLDRERNPYAGDNILTPCPAMYDRPRSCGIKVKTANFPPATSVEERAIVISFGPPAFAQFIISIVATDAGTAS
jgi:hypothetical protein